MPRPRASAPQSLSFKPLARQRQHRVEDRRRRVAHATQHAQPLGRRHGRQHPAQRDRHLGGRQRRQDLPVDGADLGVAQVGPQHGVVLGFLQVHVRQVVRGEQAKRVVQRPACSGALGRRATGQRTGVGAQRLDVALMLHMLGGDALARARLHALQHRVDEGVFVLQVRHAEVRRRLHPVGKLPHRGGVSRVHAPGVGDQLGQHQANALVDAGIDVEPRRRGRAANGEDFLQ